MSIPVNINGWVSFDDAWPPESAALDDPKVKTLDAVLVTNNIKARDRMGRMSNVWYLQPMPSCDGKDIIGFLHNHEKVFGLTHWYLPSANLHELNTPPRRRQYDHSTDEREGIYLSN